MKKKWGSIIGVFCNTVGVFCALYVGGYLMLIKPIHTLMNAFSSGTLTFTMLIWNIVIIALSTTFAGFVWCIGYILYNFFKGTDDPDWEAIEQKWKEKKAKKAAKRAAKAGLPVQSNESLSNVEPDDQEE